MADCYAAYHHFLGPKQRCWAYLVRDLEHLLHERPEDVETVAWVEGSWMSMSGHGNPARTD